MFLTLKLKKQTILPCCYGNQAAQMSFCLQTCAHIVIQSRPTDTQTMFQSTWG